MSQQIERVGLVSEEGKSQIIEEYVEPPECSKEIKPSSYDANGFSPLGQHHSIPQR